MNVKELIDAAVNASGKAQSEIAKELGIQPARISEWKSGQRKPDASEIAFFADKAGFPVIKTVAEVEADLHPRYAEIWKKAVSELRQNQGLSRFKMTKIKGPIGPLSFGLSVFRALVYFRKPVGVLV